ncbi:hypothetical protein Golax_018912 [Gossypium laxum]|uniref:Uncharacterized protein n=1 Tax=Gossypium laxum TaxID=34288 RepID=A0A7J8Z4P1_9ROSI|nr:hypothetical protein [Gossypium laxum]
MLQETTRRIGSFQGMFYWQ